MRDDTFLNESLLQHRPHSKAWPQLHVASVAAIMLFATAVGVSLFATSWAAAAPLRIHDPTADETAAAVPQMARLVAAAGDETAAAEPPMARVLSLAMNRVIAISDACLALGTAIDVELSTAAASGTIVLLNNDHARQQPPEQLAALLNASLDAHDYAVNLANWLNTIGGRYGPIALGVESEGNDAREGGGEGGAAAAAGGADGGTHLRSANRADLSARDGAGLRSALAEVQAGVRAAAFEHGDWASLSFARLSTHSTCVTLHHPPPSAPICTPVLCALTATLVSHLPLSPCRRLHDPAPERAPGATSLADLPDYRRCATAVGPPIFALLLALLLTLLPAWRRHGRQVPRISPTTGGTALLSAARASSRHSVLRGRGGAGGRAGGCAGGRGRGGGGRRRRLQLR